MARRIGLNTRWALAAIVVGATLSATAGTASADLKIVVNTQQDVAPDTSDLVASAADAATGKIDPTFAPCLSRPEEGGMDGGGNVPGNIDFATRQAQTTVNGSPIGDKATVDAAGQCSLRMAMHLASILRTNLVNTGKYGVTITFHPDLAGDTVEVEKVEGVDDAAILPPLVDPFMMASVQAAQTKPGAPITIDGCHEIDRNRTAPCVNVRLPQLVRDSPLTVDVDATSIGSGEVPGILVGGPRVTIKGLAFLGGSPAIATLPSYANLGVDTNSGIEVHNSYFGMKTDGTSDNEDAPKVGIRLSGDRATIKNNVFARAGGDDSGRLESGVGVLIAGGKQNRILGNSFGVDKTGAPIADGVGTAIRVTGLTVHYDRVDELIVHAIEAFAGIGMEGSPVPGTTLPILSPQELLGDANDIGGKGAGEGNVIMATRHAAIDIGGRPFNLSGYHEDSEAETDGTGVSGDVPRVRNTEVQGNFVGTDRGRTRRGGNSPENGDPAIVVRNGALNTTIGAKDGDTSKDAAAAGNVISFNGGPGIAVKGGENDVLEAADLDTNIARNVGRDNEGLLIDLGEEDVGNAEKVSGGVREPTIVEATTAQVRGTAAPGATVNVYLVQGSRNGEHRTGHGDVAEHLGKASARADGSWSLAVALVKDQNQKVTATANADDGTSELARNVTVVNAPAPPRNDNPTPPPTNPTPPPPPPTDKKPPTVTVLGKSVDRPSGSPSRTVTLPAPRAIDGQASDESGIARVDVALQLSRSARGSARRKAAKRCSFVDFRRARHVSRACSSPLYAKARGTTKWRLPLNAKVRRLLRRGRTYVLYVRAVDRRGNAVTRSLALRFR
jgi:hypothetical protein